MSIVHPSSTAAVQSRSGYRGRFAPTPSGPLHFGSLFGALVSYLDAKSQQGQWLLRIEDIDPPREQPGAADAILATLEAHGLYWDEQETYQSDNSERYLAHLDELEQQKLLFWCQCSRKDLAGVHPYPGTCRQHQNSRPNSAIRFLAQEGVDCFVDIFQGAQQANIQQQFGDVILRRRDGLFAYQLAVVCDDIASKISHVIRGIDLLDSVYWQRALYRAFGKGLPHYGHFAVIHNANSEQKLSKQNLAPAVDVQQASVNLQQALRLLAIDVDLDTPERMLQQAITQWQRASLANRQIITLAPEALLP
ncbi:tRNA glutamyl-Q(34) synthetase GluQRS [Reinekea thalattae]|uniref:tRNA glutamyl-Q(34) synthetase GluQRS n=1 Tax=Reinekea thalattae TaxID=2593301 RepID=A0A5C8Z7Y8_9GAMM|nr:tRNA glutamyl-Q(34) synthetase GluQRS [Reinekea thalattae]TXR54215.1 tRNA glutamyl-Q(34) synthetase GluQRS [Reinekea thalattae]